MTSTIVALCGALVLGGAGEAKSQAHAPQIRGDYIESRTADVYTGPCFSNAEVFISGDRAVMAWKVEEGSFDGVDLSGLSVAAAVKGNTTFSEDDPAQARSILIVDKNADARQRAALIALAHRLGGDRLAHVEAVKTSLISLVVEAHEMKAETAAHGVAHHAPYAPRAQFWAPGLAHILTRPLDEGDHACGNEVVAYEPLSGGVDVAPAYTLGHKFAGKGLESRWDDRNCRGSFVGHFAL